MTLPPPPPPPPLLHAAWRRACARALVGLATLARAALAEARSAIADPRAVSGSSMAMLPGGRRKLVVLGLGNWGSPWQRHSVGAALVRRLAARRGLEWRRARGGVQVARDGALLLVEPRTLMNLSGQALAGVAAVDPGPWRLLVVHDDLDRAVGKLSLKAGGSAGGHNGVRSLIRARAGDHAFERLRVGIGRPPAGREVADFVLEPFTPQELEAVPWEEALDLLEGKLED